MNDAVVRLNETPLCGSGDNIREAVVEMANSHYPEFLRFAFVVVQDAYAAEDCVQEAFINALGKYTEFRGDAAFRTWFNAIVLNQCRSYLRRKRARRETLTRRFPDNIMTDFSERVVTKTVLTDCLFKIPAKYRIPLYLYYYEDMDLLHIAEVTKTNPSTCRVRLARGRTRLKELYEKREHND